MALQQSFTEESTGSERTDAYFRIMRINIDSPLALEATTVLLDVHAFASLAARQSFKVPIWSQSFQFSITDIDLTNITSLDDIKQRLYNVLKTTDFFSNAIDV